jgi:hypothetical protein
MGATKDVWLANFCEQMGIDVPSEEEIERLLLLAGSAAHASERTAAPIVCWLVGRDGLDLTLALEKAISIEESQKGSV